MKKAFAWLLMFVLLVGTLGIQPVMASADSSEPAQSGKTIRDGGELNFLWDVPAESSAFAPFSTWLAEDYVLESTHFKFDVDAKKYLVPNISPAAFAKHSANLDKAFQSMETLVGRKPAWGGPKINVIYTRLSSSVAGLGQLNGHTQWRNVGAESIQSLKNIEKFNDRVDFVILHELAHNFTVGPWDFQVEFIADLKVFYAAEKHNFTFSNGHVASAARQSFYNTAVNNYNSGRLLAELRGNKYNNSLMFYFSPIIDNAGWGVFEQAFNSYTNNSYHPQVIYTGSDNAVKLANFIDRLSYFHGSDVLQYSLDKGATLNRMYPVTRYRAEATDLILESTSADSAAINLTGEVVALSYNLWDAQWGFFNAKNATYTVTRNGRSSTVKYNPKKFKLTPLLNNGWESLTFQSGSSKITFPAVEARSRIKFIPYFLGRIDDTFLLFRNGTTIPLFEGFEYATTVNGKVATSAWQDFPADGLPTIVNNVRQPYLMRLKASNTTPVIRPLGRTFRVTSPKQAATPKYKINYVKETIRVRRGFSYAIDNDSYTDLTAIADVDVSDMITNGTEFHVFRSTTDKRPRSLTQTIKPLPRATMSDLNLTCANGKITTNLRDYEIYNPALQRWRANLPALPNDGVYTFGIRLKKTPTKAASTFGVIKVTVGDFDSNGKGKMRKGILSAEIEANPGVPFVPSLDELDFDFVAAPVVEAPVVELPVVELPVVDLPVVDLPVEDLPIVDEAIPNDSTKVEVNISEEPKEDDTIVKELIKEETIPEEPKEDVSIPEEPKEEERTPEELKEEPKTEVFIPEESNTAAYIPEEPFME